MYFMAITLGTPTGTYFARRGYTMPGTLVKARQMAAHASTRTPQLYDRREDRVTLDEVVKINIRGESPHGASNNCVTSTYGTVHRASRCLS
jgi:hypothetical protein